MFFQLTICVSRYLHSAHGVCVIFISWQVINVAHTRWITIRFSIQTYRYLHMCTYKHSLNMHMHISICVENRFFLWVFALFVTYYCTFISNFLLLAVYTYVRVCVSDCHMISTYICRNIIKSGICGCCKIDSMPALDLSFDLSSN